MGWQSRLNKKDKPKNSCSKCNGTRIKRRIRQGVFLNVKTGFKHFNGDFDVACKCTSSGIGSSEYSDLTGQADITRSNSQMRT